MLQLHDNAITAPFHYGEYFSYSTSLRSGTFAGQAISLHGALQYAPAWLAHGLAGPDHYLFRTMVSLAAFGVLSALLFLLVVSALLEDASSKATILAAVAALLAPL